jgi:hypothetical protein
VTFCTILHVNICQACWYHNRKLQALCNYMYKITLHGKICKLLFIVTVQGCIQKFPDWVDNEINNNKHLFRSTQRVMAAKLTRLTQKIAIKLHLVAESWTICSSCSRWPVQKLLDTPSHNKGAFIETKLWTLYPQNYGRLFHFQIFLKWKSEYRRTCQEIL